MKKKLMALLLTVCLLLTLLSSGALAAPAGNGSSGDTSVSDGNDNDSNDNGGNDGGSNDNGGNDVGSDDNGGGGDDPDWGGGGDDPGKDDNGGSGHSTSDSDDVISPAPITTTTTVENAWITRADLPGYATDLYATLVNGSDNNAPARDALTQTGSFTVNTGLYERPVSSVESVDTITVTEPTYLLEIAADGNALNEESSFGLAPTKGDEAVNYATLRPGALVRTSSFNGLYVTSLTKTGNANFDSDLKATADNVIVAARSFDRDHPEVFWLNSKTKVRIITANVTRNGQNVQEAFFFYLLADDSGFSLLAPDYAAPGAIQAGIQQRDQAVKTILASIPQTGAEAQIRALNKLLTEQNEYNTSPDLNALGAAPHRCLGALTGSVGTNGPVCEGYAKAFKVLCDQLQIPCTLEMGNAKATPDGAAGLHMWNTVKLPDGNWYGVDITWDDPVVTGIGGAVSGRENEDYLMVGSSTVIRGLRFDASHQPESAGAYASGPILSAVAFAPTEPSVPVAPPAPDMPFTDVPDGAYYKDAVKWALENGVTTGTSATTFSPDATCTRGQVVTFLWRAAGSPKATGENPFIDVAADAYYADAVLWAVANGITNGTGPNTFSPNDTVTRAQTVTFLWRAAGSPTVAGESTFADVDMTSYYSSAVLWAVVNGITSGTSATTFSPDDPCTRGQIVTFLYRDMGK